MSGVVRDERTVVVEDASYRVAYLFISFALLLDVMYRSLVRQEAGWDLLAIVVLAGAVSTFYQWRHRILSGHSFRPAMVTFGVAGVVATLIAAVRVLK
jgi:hypothetical protein